MYLYYHILHTNATVDTYPKPVESAVSDEVRCNWPERARIWAGCDASMFASIHDSNVAVVGGVSLKTKQNKVTQKCA